MTATSVLRRSAIPAAVTAAAVAYISHFVGGWAAVVSKRSRERVERLISSRCCSNKVVIVTGGNGGIGRLTVEACAKAGGTVILACRSPDRGRLAKEQLRLSPDEATRVIVMELDLASISSIRRFVQNIGSKYSQLDVLILNAGIARSFLGSSSFNVTEDGLEEMMGTNFLGHFLLTVLLLPLLRKTSGARVIGLTSVAMGNSYTCGIDPKSWTLKRPDFQDWKQYGQSKLAIRLFIRELQRREPKLLCLACHPGVVAETTLMHQAGGGLLEYLYSLLMFKVLAMGPESSHLTTMYLTLAPDEELEGGECYQPIGRKLEWMSHPIQRLGGLQLPLPVKTSHPHLWSDAEEVLKGCSATVSGRAVLEPILS
eukprot:TRINITY_DN97852_c0_g1_i1.p1 TRINITY_DN97852_c0_g1~~TRINITY_DN97852_c0_g1_i1.p1  ORF type:complete len:370 (-),score=61.79 TRINITY_DN97852_c0_g1_i1:81-1190(-)